VAAGLAVWGWIIRIVICAVFLALPHVVSGVSTLVEAPPQVALQAQGAKLKAEQVKLEGQGAALKVQAATLMKQGAALKAQVAQAAAAGVTPAPAQIAAGKAEQARLQASGAKLEREAATLRVQGASLKARGTAFKQSVVHLQATAAAVPKRWQTWMWLCVAGQLLFVPLALLLRGRWSPKAAAADLSLHDVAVHTALARVESAQARA
jgi:hypothetical protein